jgi:dephospho-CoA kinase
MQYNYAIALTGGISTGKSTVANLLSLQGFRKIDADKIAHELLDKNTQNISDMFGDEYITDNKVDRKKLGELIFNNKEKKKELESLLHPQIREQIETEAKKLEEYKKPYLIDIPLFFETKSYDIEKSLVVYAPKELQIDRTIQRDKLEYDQAVARIESQMDIEEKKKLAKYIIDNSKDLKHLQSECEKFISEVVG